MDTSLRTGEKSKERQRVVGFRAERLRINRMIAVEEDRRREIGERLQREIHRLRALRRA